MYEVMMIFNLFYIRMHMSFVDYLRRPMRALKFCTVTKQSRLLQQLHHRLLLQCPHHRLQKMINVRQLSLPTLRKQYPMLEPQLITLAMGMRPVMNKIKLWHQLQRLDGLTEILFTIICYNWFVMVTCIMFYYF